ncbi:metallophosphoesterase, partial [Nanoarchaeota archaeon]
MKFAHMADLHLGGWKGSRMGQLGQRAFVRAVDICLSERVDFVLIAGDMFNTSMPGIDVLKQAVVQLQKLKKEGIRVYLIPGSHDYSPSGKTMLDV